ncbi:MAG: FecR domain-containing protein [Verrucomicrobiae bacterium]|nr:FecR domain-containing protein [Verrucomicrobiae bacterium]
MAIRFPSSEFDEAVAAVCHGTVSEDQARSLNVLLCQDSAARDAYLLALEIHSRLASQPDLFAGKAGTAGGENALFTPPDRPPWRRTLAWGFAAAAGFAILATIAWWPPQPEPNQVEVKPGATSTAVAMLGSTLGAEWQSNRGNIVNGAPLDPGILRLESGLVQIVLYSGTRVVLQGPAELELVSANEVVCRSGRLTAEVPPQAKGFCVRTPQASVIDLGTSFGLVVDARNTEVHVFKGSVDLESADQAVSFKQELPAGAGAVVEHAGTPRAIAIDRASFASLFEMETKSVAAEAMRYDQWREASLRQERDQSLMLHLNFEESDGKSDWTLPNVGHPGVDIQDATIVGCQRTSGRWPEKGALEFQGVSDRVRLSVPGEYDELTLAAWVRVQGLDRKINSLFMSDGFEHGTLHWLIRDDGVLGLTVIGHQPLDYQILATHPVVTLDQLGSWLQLAVVVDGKAGRVVHYVNGRPIGRESLRIPPPYRIGTAELGNWNAEGFGSPSEDPSLVRNFSGVFDEFFLFKRALGPAEIRALYAEGKPQCDSAITTTPESND